MTRSWLIIDLVNIPRVHYTDSRVFVNKIYFLDTLIAFPQFRDIIIYSSFELSDKKQSHLNNEKETWGSNHVG